MVARVKYHSYSFFHILLVCWICLRYLCIYLRNGWTNYVIFRDLENYQEPTIVIKLHKIKLLYNYWISWNNQIFVTIPIWSSVEFESRLNEYRFQYKPSLLDNLNSVYCLQTFTNKVSSEVINEINLVHTSNIYTIPIKMNWPFIFKHVDCFW